MAPDEDLSPLASLHPSADPSRVPSHTHGDSSAAVSRSSLSSASVRLQSAPLLPSSGASVVLPPQSSSEAPVRVLCAEDDALCRRVLKMNLEMHGVRWGLGPPRPVRGTAAFPPGPSQGTL